MDGFIAPYAEENGLKVFNGQDNLARGFTYKDRFPCDRKNESLADNAVSK